MTKPSVLVLALGFAFGCTSVGKQIGGLDDAADPATDTDSSEGGPLEDSSDSDSTTTDDCGPDTSSGIYLLALETALGPDLPLQFVVELDAVWGGDCTTITGNFSLQPLSLDPGSQTEPREFVGEPLIFENVPFDAEGNFTLDIGEIVIIGAANPMMGSDISTTLVLHGHVVHADALCGEVTGMLTSPLEYDLAGSTFAAIRLADDGSDPATLPTSFPYRCNQVPPP